MPPRLIACDLDGTLLRSDGTLDARSARALRAASRAGMLVVICTARPVRWVQALAEVAGASNVAICANGAVVWDLAERRAQRVDALLPATAREVVDRLAAARPGGSWAVEREDRFGREPQYVTRWPTPPDTLVAVVGELISEPALKLLLRDESLLADALLERARALVGDRVTLSHSNSADSLLEIAAPGVSKASALERLCAGHGIGADQVIGFGDMPNDLPMLRWCGRSVAVANAHPEVLATADEVTLSNDEAGVAAVLERVVGELSRASAGFARRPASSATPASPR